jgi:16S rRNA G966 N2-methylase RsmD
VRSASEDLELNAIKPQRADALKFVESTKQKFDLIFADPPYDFPQYPELIQSILDGNLINEDGVLIVEHPAEVDLTGFSELTETRKYGRVHFSFFQLEA